MRAIFIAIGIYLFSISLAASPVDTYTFKNEVDKTRYQALVKELRCPKCQNQNLADSNSEIAVDLREQVYAMINQNKSDGEIVNFMVERYGEFVLYRPAVSPLTYVLWYGPAIFLVIGAIVLFVVLRREPKEKTQQILSNDEQDKLQQILKDK